MHFPKVQEPTVPAHACPIRSSTQAPADFDRSVIGRAAEADSVDEEHRTSGLQRSRYQDQIIMRMHLETFDDDAD